MNIEPVRFQKNFLEIHCNKKRIFFSTHHLNAEKIINVRCQGARNSWEGPGESFHGWDDVLKKCKQPKALIIYAKKVLQ